MRTRLLLALFCALSVTVLHAQTTATGSKGPVTKDQSNARRDTHRHTPSTACNPGTITGTMSVCQGSTTALSETVTGGTWSSSNVGIASVGSNTGMVFGVAAGTATITYMVAGGCYTTAMVMVTGSPGAISGTNTLCANNGATLSDATPGGTWSSSDTIVSVNSDGVISAGSTTGVATITYSTGCGTPATHTVTVIATTAGTISGSTYVNVGSIITLSDTAGGGAGTWVAGNGNVTISSSGVVTGVTPGTVTIYYYVTGVCSTAVATYMITVNAGCTGAWNALTRTAPANNYGVMLLLTDGTVICKTSSGLGGAGSVGTIWNKLTPDTLGSYTNGTWTTIDSMTDDRLYFSSQVLKDGRVYVAGGEYGSGKGSAEIYDPVANSWSALITIAAGDSFSDANSEMLPDGRVLEAIVVGHPYLNYFFNPVTNTFTAGPTAPGNHNESAWTKLPDGSIIAVDLTNTVTGLTYKSSDRYIPSLGRWKTENNLVDTIWDQYGSEVGASFLLPNGNAFFIGANGHTAIYTPTGDTTAGTWTKGADIPGGLGAPDAAAAMMVNGQIISAVAPQPNAANNVYRTPTSFYVYDYIADSWTKTTAPGGPPGDTLSMACYQTMMLDLPDGKVLYGSFGSRQYYEYTPCTGPLAEGKPTVNTVYGSNCTNFIVTGTLFNGISEGANFNDDWQMNTNYPIIRLTAASGRVYYARSYNWNRTGVMTGTALDTAQFQLPAGLPQGTYALRVIVNGIASDPFTFNTNVGATISPSNPTVCVGGTVTLTDAGVGGTWSSGNTDRASIGSTGIVTGVSAGTVIISYTMTGGCFGTVVVTVNAAAGAGTISGATTVCVGATIQLSDTASGGSWSSTNTSLATVDGTGLVTGVSPGSVVISYTKTVTCGTAAATATIMVNASPSVTINPASASICTGGNVLLSTSAGSGGVMLEDFNSGFGAWTTDNSGTTNPSGVAVWLVEPNGFYDMYGFWYSPDFSPYAEVNGYSTSFTDVSNSRLISPVFSLAGASSATLSFQQAYFASPYDYNVEVDISTDGGGSWGLLHDYKGTSIGNATNYLPASVDLSAYAGQSNLKVRFYYYTYYYGYYWALDNVQITASGTSEAAVWSPTSSLFNDAGLTIPYDGTGTGQVYAAPASTATYTATVTSNGCTGSASRTVSVTATPAIGPITGTTTLCSGGTTHLTDVTGGGTWSSSNTDRATVGSTGLVTGVSPGTATITYSVTTGCGTADTTIVVTVGTGVTGIFGSSPICVNTSVSFSDATPGGSWTSSAPGIASVTSVGLVNAGASPGTAIISYTTSCGTATYPVTVIATSAGTISGPATVTVGLNITLSDAVAGGSWSAGNGNATVNSSGQVTVVTAGSVVISYAVTGTCGTGYATKMMTVIDSTISGITGNTNICVGTTSTLSDATPGGIWNSSNSAVATVGGTAGVVTGVSAGTAYVSYTVGGVSTYVLVNVLASPLPINGASSVCLGSTITLSDASGGGYWTSSNGNATIDGGGNVMGVSVGTSTITFMLADLCYTTYPMNVLPVPAPITGITSVCVGGTTTLTDTTSGALSWTSSNTGVATTAGDVVTGVSVGSVIITYKVTSGCYVTTDVNVMPALLNSSIYAYANITSECAGVTNIFLSDGAGAGVWTSSNTSVATVGSATGNVTGVSAGTASITYTESGASGCFAIQVVTINPSSPILGASSVCSSGTITLSDAISGGSWSSSNTSIANVSGSGVVSGVSAGSVTISYSLSSGCVMTDNIMVNAGPSAISGSTALCLGGTTTLTDATGGGVWTSSNTSVATIGSSTGLLTGTGTAVATITYTAGGCYTTITVTVSASPSAILGTKSVCTGSTTTLSDGTAGGSWSTTAGSGSVSLSGSGTITVTGVAAGTATVSYTVGSGCSAVTTVTVNAGPVAITGNAPICVGSTLTLVDTVAGGTWTSGGSAATVGSATGIVTGVSPGVVVITYSTGGSCKATVNVTVSAAIGVINGPSSVCVGSSITLSDATSGGTWTSSNPSVGSVSSSGVVTGFSAGSTIITYAVASGCSRMVTISVNSAPSAIGGSLTLCGSIANTLTDATGGGVWSSSNTTVATISSAGVVTGGATGTATITYNLSGCVTTTVVTVSPAAAITGPSTVCVTGTIALTDATAGGSWSSSNGSVATVNSVGVVSGVSAGSVTISYTLASGCVVTDNINVSTGATAISGTTSLCLGASTTLTDGTSGGVWTSSNTSVATIGSATGLLTGTGTATATITYTAGGCFTTTTVTISPAPSAILGTGNVCTGSTTTLSDGTAGGAWSTTAGSGSVSLSGTGTVTVTGVSAGTATVSYTTGSGCSVTAVVNVNAGPTAIGGNVPVCVGSTLTLTDGTGGGTWSSSNTTTATVGSGTGIVTGVAAGVVVITYSTGTSCVATANVTVNAAINAISGPSSVCVGLTIALSDGTPGGAWSSSNTAAGSVSTTGVVTGIGVGTTNITYAVAGCNRVVTISVNTAPSAIGGTLSVCGGAATTLTDATGGGTWSLSSSLIATIGSATGVVTASNTYTGTTTVSYSAGGCPAIAVLTVSSHPNPIQGAISECVGVTITLSDATAGGAWSSSNGDVSFGSTGGSPVTVTGVTAGASTITYSLGAACYVTIANTVYANPAPITGVFAVCTGLTTTLSDATAGGAWTSSAPAVASASGYTISGVTAGTAIITYKITAGNCIATQMVTVNASPVVSAISGPTSISHATPATLSDATAGGVWTSNHVSVISLSGSTGSPVTATAVATSGTATISYAVTSGAGCTTTATKIISAAPAPPHGVSGTTTLFAGATVNLAGDDAVTGLWTSSDNGIASVDAYGTVTGINPGIANITHTITNNGDVTTNVTTIEVAALPMNVSVIPNPNKGTFTVNGTMGSTQDEEVTLEVTDVLGQVIYRNTVTAQGGRLNEMIMLNNVANGMYLLNVHSTTGSKAFHFVIEQ